MSAVAEQGTWCVYLPEFLVMYQSAARGRAGLTECGQEFTGRYLGRVLDGDWRVVPESSEGKPRYRLELRLPNLKGEFVKESRAREHAAGLGSAAVVVPWGSQEECRLQEYGFKRLRNARTGT